MPTATKKLPVAMASVLGLKLNFFLCHTMLVVPAVIKLKPPMIANLFNLFCNSVQVSHKSQS